MSVTEDTVDKSRVRAWSYDKPLNWAPFWPLAVGYMDCVNPIIRQNQSYISLHIVLRGALSFSVNGQGVGQLSRGDVFVSYPHVPFSYKAAESASALYWIRLRGPLLDPFLKQIGFSDAMDLRTSRDSMSVFSAFEQLFDLATHATRESCMQAIALLYQIAATCCEEDRYKTLKGVAERAKLFIDTSSGHGINVNQVSEALGVSRSCLFRGFKGRYGKSPLEYLKEVRLRHAQDLLQKTDLSIGEVALASGYSNYLNLVRAFKEVHGVSPGDYRLRANQA